VGDRARAQRVEQHFLPGILEALRAVGYRGEVAVCAGTAAASADASAPLADGGATHDPSASVGRRAGAGYTFDCFVVGESNRFAHDAARRVAESPGTVHNPLYLHGAVGLGKTHLATAVANAAVERGGARAAVVFSAGRFLSVAERAEPASEALEEATLGAGVAVFDDVQFLSREERVVDVLFQQIDELIGRGCQVVLTCDLPPPAIPTLAVRLRSRCEDALVTEILPPDLELRRRIVRNRAAAAGTRITDDVVEFVARAEEGSVRALEGAFNRVRELAESTARELTLALARQALARRSRAATPPALAAIASVVAGTYGRRVRDLRARRRRDRAASLARQVAVHLARRLSGRTLNEIAFDLGVRDHSVAAHACAALRERIGADPELGRQIGAIERRLAAGAGGAGRSARP
jgi:chromosomal replication initiator protein